MNLKKLLGQAGFVVTGQVVSAAFGLLSSVLAARMLGATDFGILALLHTAMLVAERFATFQPWQALMRFGSQFTGEHSREKLEDLIALGLILDLAGAAIAVALAISGLLLAGQFGWLPSPLHYPSLFYALVLGTALTGVPIFILRLAGRFERTAMQQAFTAIARTLLLFVAIKSLNLGLPGAVAAYAAAHLMGNCLLLFFASRELTKQALKPISRGSPKRALAAHVGIVKFVASTHASGTLRMAMKEADIFIVSFFGGAVASGFYKIAKQFGSVLAFTVEPITQVIYPELTRLWSANLHSQFRQRFLMVGSWGTSAGFLAVLGGVTFGEALVLRLFGPQYLEAFPTILICLAANAVAVATCAFQPTILALGKADRALRIVVFSTIVQLAALLLLSPSYGALGAAIAQLIYYIVWSYGTLREIRAEFRTEQLAIG